MHGSQVVIEMLLAQGVQHVFGVPGDTSVALYDAFYAARGRLRHVMARDERSAAFMADAYARAANRPGVCEGPSGGGATYILPGVAEANFSSVPILVLTTDNPVTWEGKGELTAIDQVAALRAATKWSAQVKRVEQLPDMMRQAWRAMVTGRPGAAHLVLPEDVLEAEAGEPDLHVDPRLMVYPAYRTRPDPELISEAADALLSAERPVILCGGGAVISRAWRQVLSLAEAVGSPVATTINGKGSMAENHPLSLGVTGGNGGRPYANAFVAGADLVLAVGTRLNRVATAGRTLFSPGVRLIQVDIDPVQIGNNYPVEVGIVGDASLALADLVAAVGERMGAGGPRTDRVKTRSRELRDLSAAFWAEMREKAASATVPVKPQRIIQELSVALPDDAVLVVDPGTMTPFVAAQYVLRRVGRSMICPRAHGGLGYAIPGVVGARLARPGSAVVGICGDGSFGMSAGDLETIHRVGEPAVVIQMNNGVYGWIKMLQKLYHEERYFGVDFAPDVDYVAVARGFGLQAVRVTHPDEIGPAIKEALASPAPTFIDIPTQPETEESPPVDAWLRALGERR